MNDDEFTALIPFTSAGASRRGWRCPDEALLAVWVERGLPEGQREGLKDHVADCSYCCGQLGFLARSSEPGPPPAVPVQLLAAARGERSKRHGALRPATLLATSAALCLVLLVAGPFGRHGVPSQPGGQPQSLDARQVRTSRGEAGSPWILRPSEGERVAQASLEFEWEGAPDALFYTVQIVDPSGDVVWEGRAESAHLMIPAEAALTPGQPYFAWVLAHLRSGATSRSPAVGFRLAPG